MKTKHTNLITIACCALLIAAGCKECGSGVGHTDWKKSSTTTQP